ncbi:MAG: glycolate oxidase subunit GlcE [Halioglobus sp.]
MNEARGTALPGDHSEDIIAALRQARAERRPVYISAGGSKRHWLGRHCEHALLDISAHRGIVDYQPRELVLTARAATPLTEIEAALGEAQQVLPFEPPLLGGRATLGGTLACNLSGPARPWRGSVRDAILGVQLINGKCEHLSFGGRVMKNVAGYDVARLQAGALGSLGVLTQISLKVLPRAEKTLTLRYDMAAAAAIETMNRRAGAPKPLSGACWYDGALYLRLSGAATAVDSTAMQWGGEPLEESATPWHGLREMTLPYFDGAAPLWRFSIKPSAPLATAAERTLIDWCGAQRWLRGAQAPAEMHRVAAAAGGHVIVFRGGDRHSEVRTPLGPVQQALQQRLKRAFDPDGILNPGLLYSWL